MTLPTQFTDTIRNKDHFTVNRWLEIEGLPNAFGSWSKDAGWFTARTALLRFLTIKPYFEGTPDSFDAQLDVLDGMAKVMGQTEFAIVDVEGEQTLWAGAWDNTYTREMDGVITAASVTIKYTGVAADTTAFPLGGGTIYIGNETITYTAHNTGTKEFTGCTRGKYRSKAQAWVAGSIISHKPYAMYGRRVWYYQCVQAVGGTAPTDADKVLRFSGTVENLTLDEDLTTYKLTCLSLEKELTRDIFRDLRTIRDDGNRGIVGTDYTKAGIRFPGDPGATLPSTCDRLYGGDITQLDEGGTSHFVNGAYYMFRVDKELIMFQSALTTLPSSLKMVARALMGTPPEEHREGFQMQEVAFCARYVGSSVLWEHAQTKFTSAPNTVSQAAGDHPLIALLCILLSTGNGTNYDGGRNYDVLPASWGLGIPYDRIDVQGIMALANETPDLVLNGYWDKPVKFTEFAKQCLAPFGFYGVTLIGDLWTVRRLQPPLPDQTTRDIDNTAIISKSKLGWDANLLGLVQEVEFYYNRDVQFGKWTSHSVFINGLGKAYAQGRGRRLTYELPQLYSKGPTPIPGRPPLGGTPNVELVLAERLEFFKQGFTLPPPIINLRLRYDWLDIEPGDLVHLSQANIPRIQDGLRGVSLQTMRVLRKTVNEASKTVEVTLQDCGFGVGDFGYVCPALQVMDISYDPTMLVQTNAFTDAIHATGVAQNDQILVDIDGNQYDWLADYLQYTDQLLLVSKDFANTAQVTHASHDSVPSGGYPDPWVEITTSFPGWFSIGDYVMPIHDNADGATALINRYFVFLVDSDLVLDAFGARPAFRYFP